MGRIDIFAGQMNSFSNFVIEHENDDLTGLVLQRDRWQGIDVALAADTIAGRRKMKTKAPSWYACAEVVYPSQLCVEQCSSEAACAIKCSVLEEVCGLGCGTENGQHSSESVCGLGGAGLRVADLTGGLGVDSWAFSKISSEVLYAEMNPALAAAARHNFAALGCDNITVLNAAVTPDGLAATEGSAASWDIIRDFAPDIIYLDPARRSATGSKVFKLEDCHPDILQLKDTLLTLAKTLIVKLSPMADIDMVLRQMGPRCKRLDVISVGGECKEILLTLDRNHDGECLICADCGQPNTFSFFRSEEEAAVPILAQAPAVATAQKTAATAEQGEIPGENPLSGQILLEPDKALMKAAPFKFLSSRFNLTKLAPSTHYYISARQCVEAELPAGLFKQFRILQTAPLDKKSMKSIAQQYPGAEVTARNIPLSTDDLRKRLTAKPKALNNAATEPSAQIHIFGLRINTAAVLLVTERM